MPSTHVRVSGSILAYCEDALCTPRIPSAWHHKHQAHPLPDLYRPVSIISTTRGCGRSTSCSGWGTAMRTPSPATSAPSRRRRCLRSSSSGLSGRFGSPFPRMRRLPTAAAGLEAVAGRTTWGGAPCGCCGSPCRPWRAAVNAVGTSALDADMSVPALTSNQVMSFSTL